MKFCVVEPVLSASVWHCTQTVSKSTLVSLLYLMGLLQKHVKSAAAPYRQKNFQRLRRKPGITTIRKKAQLTRVKTLMNSPPLPGYSRT